MKGGKTPLGYTLIEVMIVLAVSGTMFLIAANFISGKQARTAFSQGVNEFASRIEGVAAQVADGQYSDISWACHDTGTTVIIDFTTPSNQGTNKECVFLGKVIHVRATAGWTDYDVFSLAGKRLNTAVDPPVPPKNPNEAGGKSISQLATTSVIPQHLHVKGVVAKDIIGNSHTSYGVGFISTGNFDISNNAINGAQSVGLYYIDGLNGGMTIGAAQGQIQGSLNRILQASLFNICVTDGSSTGSRYAQIFVGTDDGSTANGNPTSVKVKMRGSSAC
jgi:prepilin-type N-terminal cleavage/methylation domain-containing protein